MRGIFGGLAIVAIAGAALALLIVQSADISAQSGPPLAEADLNRATAPIRWRVASQFPITLPETGTLAAETMGRIEALSGGKLRLDLRGPTDVAQPLALFEAVAAGAFEAAFLWPATARARTAAVELYGGIPFGPTAVEFLAWHEQAGKALRDEIYRAHNIYGVLCGMAAAGGTWLRPEVRTPADLDRRPFAAVGLAARTLATLGAHPAPMVPAEIARAFREGKIAGAAILTPAADRQIMRDSGAKRYVFPSWQRSWIGLDLVVNLGAWEGLSARERQAVEQACAANVASSLAASEAAQYEVLKDMIKDGVDVRRLSEPFMAALRAAWTETLETLMREDPDFRRAWLSLSVFRENHALWRELTEVSGQP